MNKFYWAICVSILLGFSSKAQKLSLLKDINPGPGSGLPDLLMKSIDIDGTLFFPADDGTHGLELWKSDGTDAGTVMVKEINSLTGHANPDFFTNVDGILFFTAQDGVSPRHRLYKSDGTEAGTVLVKDIDTGIPGDGPVYLTNLNGTLFFTTAGESGNAELWKSDGTEAGTMIVKDINPGPGAGLPMDLLTIEGTVFFSAYTPGKGRELWKSNGTEEGTLLVKDIHEGPGDGSPAGFINLNGTLFFSAYTPGSGRELWKTDGTEAGTVLVRDINEGTGNSSPAELMGLNNTLFFTATDAANGTELWKSDGTTAGTILVKDIHAGPAGSNVVNSRSIQGMILFEANDGINGRELWRSNGTAAGTVMVKNIGPGAANGYTNSQHAAVFEDKLIFNANDGTHSEAVWESDGTGASTKSIAELGTAVNTGAIRFFTTGSKLLICFPDNSIGREFSVITFSEGNGSSSGIGLPLTMVDFKGKIRGEDGLLTWKTVAEHNATHFEIERSVNNRNYTKVGTTTATNTGEVYHYSFTDQQITSLGIPVLYYRLKMKDIDDNSVYSKVVAINIDNEQPVVVLYPNPLREGGSLVISVVRKETLTYCIVDQYGRIIQQKSIVVTEGSNTVPLETASLASGLYTILIKGSLVNTTVKFVKQ